MATVNLASTATDPTITEGTFLVTSASSRAVKILLNGTMSGSNYIQIRTISFGFN